MKEPRIEEIRDRLQQLKADTQQLLKEAWLHREHPRATEWTVNWADFGVWRTSWFIDDSGDDGFTVDLAEASPDNNMLRMWLQEHLEAKGHDNVEINFNW